MHDDPAPYYLTTPIFYVNDRPHVGHAYTMIACDAVARCRRLEGRAVRLMTGTDEHGQKVEKAARAAGEAPRAFVDRMSGAFRDLAPMLGCAPDDFARTTDASHHEAVAALWRRLEARGELYLGAYSGWYAVRDEAYFEESETTVGEDGARRAPSGAEVEWLEEPSWFFRLSRWGDALLRHYEENPEFVGPPERANEVRAFVESGLRDLSVSRSGFSWGVPAPGAEGHVVYVWMDALMIYMSAAGGVDAAEAGEGHWPADLHMVGKDILRFHAVYWPAMLMAAGLPLPRRVFGHGWLLSRGRKMSKSEGNVLRPAELTARYGLDNLRYYLMREVPFGQDGYIGHETLLARCNAELANGVGNLAQRSLAMVARFLGGAAPGLDDPAVQERLSEEDRALVARARALPAEVSGRMAVPAPHLALEAARRVAEAGDRRFDAAAPWRLARAGDEAALAAVLAATLETLRCVAHALLPFVPDGAGRLLEALGDPEPPGGRRFSHLEAPLPGGRRLPTPEPVFRRLEDDGEGEGG